MINHGGFLLAGEAIPKDGVLEHFAYETLHRAYRSEALCAPQPYAKASFAVKRQRERLKYGMP